MLRKMQAKTLVGLCLSTSLLSLSAYAGHWNTAPNCCPKKVSNCHINSTKYNFPDFYDVVTENSPKSNANQDLCVKDLLCFSGVANFDLLYSDRWGTGYSALGGSFLGVGVRPLFGINSNEVLGNINNINLFVDVNVASWVSGHFDFAYVNASRRSRTYSNKESDWGSVYRTAAALKVNQAYLLAAKPECTPFYFKIGRFNHPFGTYESFNLTPSLTQLLSEIRAGGLVFGAVFENGLYGSIQYTAAQQSIESLNGPTTGGGFSGDVVIPPNAPFGFTVGDNKDRNYGFKMGFRSCFNNVQYHVNGAYIADIRDSDYLLEGTELFNIEYRQKQTSAGYQFRNSWAIMKRAAGMSLHADVDYCGFGLTANFVKALSGLNFNQTIPSKISAYDVTAHAEFAICGYKSRFRLSYQGADDPRVHHIFVRVVDGTAPPPVFVPQVGNVLPCHRYQADYCFELTCNISATLQWVHDVDWDQEHAGTDRASNFGLLRIHAEF